MNAEISKIRNIRNSSEIFDHKPVRIAENRMSEMIVELNKNFSHLYSLRQHNIIDNIEAEFLNRIAANIYIILNMFNEMGIYPDYFYDEVVKMRIEYKNLADNSNNLRVNYRLLNGTSLPSKLTKAIERGLENGYYRIQAYPKKDINDAFLEMTGFFEAYNIPHNINTPEQYFKTFGDISYNHLNTMEKLNNSDDIIDDVEYLSKLLFEYMSFFVSVGVYPKDYIENIINSVEGHKTK